MILREPSREELNKWKLLGRNNLYLLVIIESLYEHGIITNRNKKMIQNKINKKGKEEHWEFNPFNPKFAKTGQDAKTVRSEE